MSFEMPDPSPGAPRRPRRLRTALAILLAGLAVAEFMVAGGGHSAGVPERHGRVISGR